MIFELTNELANVVGVFSSLISGFINIFYIAQDTKLRLKSEIPDSPKLGYEVHQVGILQLLIGAGWEGRERELAQLS